MELISINKIENKLKKSISYRFSHLLNLVDKSPHSPSFGCFDRSYWLYKIKDFPAGMSQESIYPISLILDNKMIPNISDYSKNFLVDLINAGSAFSLENQNFNGSIDDYFPYEQASGASAFTAYALISALEISQLNLSERQLSKLRKRIIWLSRHKEAGKLSNHESLICLVLAKSAILFKSKYFYKKSLKRLERLVSWRDEEGWFNEYGGFDVGYETLTFSFLYELQKINSEFNERLNKLLLQSFKIIVDSIEPDGSLGGELFSRGTWNCFTHGILEFSIDKNFLHFSKILRLIESRYANKKVNVQDDFILQHHLWSDIKTYLIIKNKINLINKEIKKLKNEENTSEFVKDKNYPNAGHIWISRGETLTHISTHLGGSFRLYKKGKFITQDTQNILQIRKDTFLANSFNNNVDIKWINKNKLIIEGYLTKYSHQKMTTTKLIILRIFMLAIGRFVPNLVRKIMQKLLIKSTLNKKRYFSREFLFSNNNLEVIDKYRLLKSEYNKTKIIETNFENNKHVIMSKIFHPYLLHIKSPNIKEIFNYKNFIIIKRNWN